MTPNLPPSLFANNPRAAAIAEAAVLLNELRENWLNPPDLVKRVPGYPDRLLPTNDEAAVTLQKRTLTNLYNDKPDWLIEAHTALDTAVSAAYGWPEHMTDDEILGDCSPLIKDVCRLANNFELSARLGRNVSFSCICTF